MLARNAITRNSVSVQTRLADGLFPVHGDRVQLQQVVLNLTLNAVEAMGSALASNYLRLCVLYADCKYRAAPDKCPDNSRA